MTEERLPLAELLAKAGDGDFLRSVAEAVVQLLMETDVEGLIGAGRHERSGYPRLACSPPHTGRDNKSCNRNERQVFQQPASGKLQRVLRYTP